MNLRALSLPVIHLAKDLVEFHLAPPGGGFGTTQLIKHKTRI